jgi:hypothetical protein
VHELRELRLAVEHLHGCKARHLRSEPVKEVFEGMTVWEGIVEVFELSGHSQAKLCYSWKHWKDDQGQQTRIVNVPGVSPIDSPVAAVMAAIVADHRRNRKS